MKMKEFRSRGGAHPWRPLRSANAHSKILDAWPLSLLVRCSSFLCTFREIWQNNNLTLLWEILDPPILLELVLAVEVLSQELPSVLPCLGRPDQQWRIQNFPEGAPTPKGETLNYYILIFCRKLHENERNWTESGCALLKPPLPLRRIRQRLDSIYCKSSVFSGRLFFGGAGGASVFSISWVFLREVAPSIELRNFAFMLFCLRLNLFRSM